MRTLKEPQDFEDVALEQHDIRRAKKQFGQAAWLLWVILFAANAALLTVILQVASWAFAEVNRLTLLAVVCSAYVCAVILVATARLQGRVDRMEMHALTVQSEILKLQERLDDLKRGTWSCEGRRIGYQCGGVKGSQSVA